MLFARNSGLRASAFVAGVATLGALLTAIPSASAVAAQSPASCSPTSALVNGSFEFPDVPDEYLGLPHEDDVPGWSTTASDNILELWDQPFLGVDATSGRQLAELNANEPATLFQEIATVPGETLRWSLDHRGRDGFDEMSINFGAPGESPNYSQLIGDGQAWGNWTGLYVVPVGQTTTRLELAPVSAAGSPSSGNLVDNIALGGEACLVTTKSVVDVNGGGVEVGDVLEYTVNVDNRGGSPATNVSVGDTLPASVSFVPGSLATSSPLTDAPADDAGEYVSGVVTARIGDGANAVSGGSLPAGESRDLSFRASVNADASGSEIANTAITAFTESLTGSSRQSTSNTVSTNVLPSADLAVSHVVTSGLKPGDSFEIVITVDNNGPDAATDATLTALLPPLDGISVTDPDCAVVAGDVECTFGLLTEGIRVLTITGTIPGDAAAGSDLSVATAVDATSTDLAGTNNSDSTTAEVAAVATIDLAFELAPEVSGPVESGDELIGLFEVVNTGNVILTNVTVSSPLFGSIICAVELLPGEGASCSPGETYTVTDKDARQGTVTTTAAAEGTPPIGSALATATAAASDSITVAALPVVPEDENAPQDESELAVTGVDPFLPLSAALALLTLGSLLAGSSLRRRREASASL